MENSASPFLVKSALPYRSAHVKPDILDAADFVGIDQRSTQVAIAAVDTLLSMHHFGERGVATAPKFVIAEGISSRDRRFRN